MRGSLGSGMPMPVSRPGSRSPNPRSRPLPPPGPLARVYLTAFSTRLVNIESSSVSSPRTVYWAAGLKRFHCRVMFFFRATRPHAASTVISTLRTSTGTGLDPSWPPGESGRGGP